MALFVLIILGLSLGWFSSILAHRESSGSILRQMGVGLAAALVGGLSLNSGTILGGLSLFGLAAAVVAAFVALVIYNAIANRGDEARSPAE